MGINNKIEILKIGSDPEFLLIDKNTSKFKSSIGIIPGTKENPLRLDFGTYYTIQIDNVLGEISVDPAETGDELWDNIQKTLNYVKKEYLPENIELEFASSGEYEEKELDHPVAKILGCDSSYNAWTFEENPAPEAKTTNLRGCGCHFHISYKDPDFMTNLMIGQVFDVFGTLQSVFRDPDTIRRKFYGKAGEVRNCEYGVELRTPGGYTLSSKEEFDIMIQAIYDTIEFMNLGGTISDEESVIIQDAINSQNKVKCIELYKSFSKRLSKLKDKSLVK